MPLIQVGPVVRLQVVNTNLVFISFPCALRLSLMAFCPLQTPPARNVQASFINFRICPMLRIVPLPTPRPLCEVRIFSQNITSLGEIRHSEGNPKLVSKTNPDRFQPRQTNLDRFRPSEHVPRYNSVGRLSEFKFPGSDSQQFVLPLLFQMM